MNVWASKARSAPFPDVFMQSTAQIADDYSPDVFQRTRDGAGHSAPQTTMSGGPAEAAFPPGLPIPEHLQDQSYEQMNIDMQRAIDGPGSAWHENGDPESRVQAWQKHVADHSTNGLHRLVVSRFEEILSNYHPTCSLRQLYEMELELQQLVPAPDYSPFKSLKLGPFIPPSRSASVVPTPSSHRSRPTSTIPQQPGVRPPVAHVQPMRHPVPHQQMPFSWGSNETPPPGAQSLSSGAHYPAPQPQGYQQQQHAYQQPPHMYTQPPGVYQPHAYQPQLYAFQHTAPGYQRPLSSFGQHAFNAHGVGSSPTFLAQQPLSSYRLARQELGASTPTPPEPGDFLQSQLAGQEQFARQPQPTSHESRHSPSPTIDPRNFDMPRQPSSALHGTAYRSRSSSPNRAAAAPQQEDQTMASAGPTNSQHVPAAARPDGPPKATPTVRGDDDAARGDDDDVGRGDDAVHVDKLNAQRTAKSVEPASKTRSRGVPARQAGIAGMTKLQYRVQDYLPSARQLFMSRDRIPEEDAQELYKFSLHIQSLIIDMAEKLGIPANVAFTIVTAGIGFGPNSDWNLFQTFHSLDPGVWTERDRDLYAHYGSLPAKSAYKHFKKVEGYKNILLKFACAFPASRPVKTVGDREVLVDGIDTHLRAVQSHLFAVHNLSLSYIITGADAANDGPGLTRMRSAQLGRGFLRMLQIPDDLFAGAFRSFVQYNAQLCAVSKELRLPLPETQFEFDRIPKLTDPATYPQPHHLGRIWNDNMNAVLEGAKNSTAIHPQLAMESVRPNDCLFNNHLVAMSRLGLKIVGHPAGIPIFWVLGNAPDRGVYALQSAAQGAFLQWLLLRDAKDPTHPHALGLSIQYAGDTSNGERFTVYQTREFNWPGHEYHGLVATYNLHTHTVASPSLRELAEYRKGTGELEKLYGIKMKESEQAAKKKSSTVKSAEFVRDGDDEQDGRPVPRRVSGKLQEVIDVMDDDKTDRPASSADLAAVRIAAARASEAQGRAAAVSSANPTSAGAAAAATAVPLSVRAAAASDDSDSEDGLQPGPSSKVATGKRKARWTDNYSDSDNGLLSDAADGSTGNTSRVQKKARITSPDADRDQDINTVPGSGRSPGFYYGEQPDGPSNVSKARWAPPSSAKSVGAKNLTLPPLEPFDWRTCGDAKDMQAKDRTSYKTALTHARKRALTENKTRALKGTPAAAAQSTPVPDSERPPAPSPIVAQSKQAVKLRPDTAAKRTRDGEDEFEEPEPKRGRARSRSAPPSKVHRTRSASRGPAPPPAPQATSTAAPAPPPPANPAPPTPGRTTRASTAGPPVAVQLAGKVGPPAAAARPTAPHSRQPSAGKTSLDPAPPSTTPRLPSSGLQAPSTASRAPSTRSRAPSGSMQRSKATPAPGTVPAPPPASTATGTPLPLSGNASAPLPGPSGPTSMTPAAPPAASPSVTAAGNDVDRFPNWMQGVGGDVAHHRKVLSAFQEVRRVLKFSGATPNTPAFNANLQLLYGVFDQWNTNQGLPSDLVRIFKWLVPLLEDEPDARMVIPDWLKPLDGKTFKHADVLLALRAVRRSILLGSTYSPAQAQFIYEVYEGWEGSFPPHIAPLFMHVVVEMEKKSPV
ncbi:hypothetical protein AURDEDRAFT_128153 [Auricularia subglabra TFB-10046 SS5]|nr:hypothetical protein AURDEDRAFT_128153 [Auricularia subglabra TFB-10046 SS5]